MSEDASDVPLVIVVASSRVSVDAILGAVAARLPGCRAIRASDAELPSPRQARVAASAPEPSNVELSEPTPPAATALLVAASVPTALKLKAAHSATVTIALVDVVHLRLRALWRDPHRSPESEQLDFLAQHAGEFDYVIGVSRTAIPHLNEGKEDDWPPEADTLVAIVEAERYRTSRQQALVEQMRKTAANVASGRTA